MSINILSIETSTKTCSVALHSDGLLVAHTDIHLDKSHSSHLVVMIEHLLQYAGVSKQQLNAIAVSKGPGSYTGLRIGTSTAKGLCFALDIPFIAVSTLESLACTYRDIFQGNYLFCPMIDARRMEVYTALYDSHLNVLESESAEIIEENFLNQYLVSNKIVLIGDGAIKTHSILSNENFIKPHHTLSSAIGVGSLAYQKYLIQDFENLAYFEPFYLKDYKATKSKKLI